MGQYFKAVNVTKFEYVDPYEIGGLAKLWEWCSNKQAGIFPYLLRKSSGRGGGDVQMERPVYAGRWAGDMVYLVGDYDDGGLYHQIEFDRRFGDISARLAEEYNRFIEVEELQLEVPPFELGR